MHMLALALALSTAQPAPVPAPPTRAHTFELQFSAPPPEMPAATDWKGAQAEGLVTHTDVPAALAAKDAITEWLVDQKVCAADVKVCRLLLHFSMVDEHPEKEVSTTVVRYIARGAKGDIAEGYSLAPGKDPTVYRFYRHAKGVWTESEKDARTADYQLIGSLIGLVNGLAREGLIGFYPQ